jgi:hypothetical protein
VVAEDLYHNPFTNTFNIVYDELEHALTVTAVFDFILPSRGLQFELYQKKSTALNRKGKSLMFGDGNNKFAAVFVAFYGPS